MQARITIWTCLAISCFCLHKLNGQQFSIRKYTAVDGLPQSEVRAIAEDKNGYLWIATQGGGLARFDGRVFDVYTTLDGLLSNIVSTLMIDSKNNIWMAHPRGITKFDGRSFKQFTQPSGENGTKRIRRIYEHGDSVFFVTNPGLIGKIHNDSVHYWDSPIVPDKMIFFTYVKPGHSIIHYLNDSSFIYFYGNKQRKLSHKNIFGRAKNLFSMGKRLVIKSEEGFYELDVKADRLVKMDIPISNHIIYYDTAKQVYWTRSENKLYKEKSVDGQLTSELVYDGAEISQVFPDGEGNTWIGSLGDGLIRHFTRDFDRCGSDKLRMVMAIANEPDGATWIGSANNGLWKMSKGKIKTYPLPENSAGAFSIKINTNGIVFVHSKTGLGMYNKATDTFKWMNRSDGLSSSYVSVIEPDDQGGLWIGTFMGGLNYFDGKTFSLFPDLVNMKAKNISSMKFVPSTKTLFIGTDYGLIELQQDGKMKSIRLPEFDNTSLLSIQPYQDSLLLIGSGGSGVTIYNPKTQKRKTITPKEGLASGFVFFVAADEQDRIWVGTVNGINHLKLNTHWEIVENRYYGFDSGLTGIETNQNAFHFNGEEKYFGLIDGLYQFNDSKVENFKSFATHLTGIDILFGQEDVGRYGEEPTGFFKLPTQLSVPHNSNHLTFHFNRVDKRNPKSVQYKYFLENFDKSWSYPTSMNSVTYSNLPSGKYTFKVMATDKGGRWEENPLTYSFEVQTPFYQTAWFIGFAALALAGSALLGIMYRVRHRVSKAIEVELIRQKELEGLRKEIARDFHDEMGNQLTRIINYVSLLKLSASNNGNRPVSTSNNGMAHGHGNETDNSHASHSNGKENVQNQITGFGDLLNKVEASAKHLYTGTRDFIWAIDPVNDELSQLFIHLRDFGVKIFEEKQITFRANNHVREMVKLPYGFSREANLIFKEAMTNAFKHSQAKNVMLSISKSQSDYKLTLTDDGIGFSYASITMNGLKNIRGRAEKINARLMIDGAPHEGTTVILSFKGASKNSSALPIALSPRNDDRVYRGD